MKISVDWMLNFANNPNFIVEDIEPSKWPDDTEPVWEVMDGSHRADGDVFVHYFYSNGQPTHGAGGRDMAGTYRDGSKFLFKGYWSSRASCVNQYWPSRPIVDVTCGLRATAIHSRVLVRWWQNHTTDWGLSLVRYKQDFNGEMMILPTRADGTLKNESQFVRILDYKR